jgi:hypothetical protein
MAVADPIAQPVALALLECYREQIADTINPPAQVCMRAGAVVNFLLSMTEDECCGGLAWVRVAQVYPTSGEDFPAADETPIQDWPNQWGVVLELGSARCVPVGTATHIPTCDQWTLVSSELAADAAAMRRAILCCLRKEIPYSLMSIGAWEPADIEGGCAAGTMTVTLSVDGLDCCPESP